MVHFGIRFIVQDNVIDKGEMPKYFTKYVNAFFLWIIYIIMKQYERELSCNYYYFVYYYLYTA